MRDYKQHQRGSGALTQLTRSCLVLAILGVVIVLGALWWFGSNWIKRYDTCLAKYEQYNGGRSTMVTAMETCSTKIQVIWSMAEQAGQLEVDLQTGYAQGRSGVESAQQDLQAALNDAGSTPVQLQGLARALQNALSDMSITLNATMEAVPTSTVQEGFRRAQIAADEAMNVIQTATDDWIFLTTDYNTYRRSTVTDFFIGLRGAETTFPESLSYYRGSIDDPETATVDFDDLAPPNRDG